MSYLLLSLSAGAKSRSQSWPQAASINDKICIHHHKWPRPSSGPDVQLYLSINLNPPSDRRAAVRQS